MWLVAERVVELLRLTNLCLERVERFHEVKGTAFTSLPQLPDKLFSSMYMYASGARKLTTFQGHISVFGDKLESRLPGEISITSDMQMTPPLWQKAKRN